MEKKIDQGVTRKGAMGDLKHTSMISTLGGPGSPYRGGPSSSPYIGSKAMGGAKGVAAPAANEEIGGGSGDEEGVAPSVEPHPLLLSRVCVIVIIFGSCEVTVVLYM